MQTRAVLSLTYNKSKDRKNYGACDFAGGCCVMSKKL